jgi:3-oxoacyl-[acyl-carrier protein] reductase
MDLGIQQKVALVLGAGGGLGGAVAITLAKEGAQVAVADLSPEASQAVAKIITDSGRSAISLAWDLGNLSMMADQVAQVEREFGPIDILINITGGPPATPALGQEISLWHKHFQSMVLSVIALTDRVISGMRARGWGRIITSTSSGVVAPILNLGISNALRSSLVGWSKTLAREVAREGVTANIVVPGRIATKRVAFLDKQRAEREGKSVETISAESAGSVPIGRYGKPQEFADVVTFIASERASYITGAVIRVDGGLIPSI